MQSFNNLQQTNIIGNTNTNTNTNTNEPGTKYDGIRQSGLDSSSNPLYQNILFQQRHSHIPRLVV